MTTDKEAAEYYIANKGDADQWGEAVKVERPQKQRLGSMVSVRFSREEVEAIRDAADRAGQSVSQFVRSASIQSARSQSGTGAAAMSQTGFVGHSWTTGAIIAPVLAPSVQGPLVTAPEGTRTLAQRS